MRSYYDKNFKGIVCTPSNAEDCLQTICNIGFDYDGYNDTENLKHLIDEFVSYAKLGIDFIHRGKCSSQNTKDDDEKSWIKAFAEQKENL